MASRFVKLFAALTSLTCVAVALAACVSDGSSEFSHEVVSKSKESEPLWAKQKHAVLIRDNANYSFVAKASEVVNLPLGIKNTQLAAMESSRAALIESLRDEATKGLSAATAKSLRQNQVFGDTLADLAKRRHADAAKVSDIYFEQYYDSSRSDEAANQAFYKIYVLVAIPAEIMPQLVRDVGNHFKDSTDGALRAVGMAIQARYDASAGS